MGAAVPFAKKILRDNPEYHRRLKAKASLMPRSMVDAINDAFLPSNIDETKKRFAEAFEADGEEYRFGELMRVVLDLDQVDARAWRDVCRELVPSYARRMLEKLVVRCLASDPPKKLELTVRKQDGVDVQVTVSKTSTKVSIVLKGPKFK